jgi:hypothetical protein
VSTLLRDMQGYAWFFFGYEATIHYLAGQHGKTKADLEYWQVGAAVGKAGSAAGRMPGKRVLQGLLDECVVCQTGVGMAMGFSVTAGLQLFKLHWVGPTCMLPVQ